MLPARPARGSLGDFLAILSSGGSGNESSKIATIFSFAPQPFTRRNHPRLHTTCAKLAHEEHGHVNRIPNPSQPRKRQIIQRPKSEAGKAVSALNNTRHGLTGALPCPPQRIAVRVRCDPRRVPRRAPARNPHRNHPRRSHGSASLASPPRSESGILLLRCRNRRHHR